MERCFYHFWTQKGPPLEENIGAMKVPPNSYLYISDPMSNWVNRANNFSQLILFSVFFASKFDSITKMVSKFCSILFVFMILVTKIDTSKFCPKRLLRICIFSLMILLTKILLRKYCIMVHTTYF